MATLKNVEHHLAQHFRESLSDDIANGKSVSGNWSVGELTDKLNYFNDLKTGYNATNYKRSLAAFSISALSGGAYVASLYLMPTGDITTSKVRIGTFGVCTTSLASAFWLKSKSRDDIFNAMHAAAHYKVEK